MTRPRREDPLPPVPQPDPLPAPPSAARPEVPPPPPAAGGRGKLAALVAALLVVGVMSGFGVAILLHRGPCSGAAFVSTDFSYCVEPPEGWSAEAASTGESPSDVFRHEDGVTIVSVQAVGADGETLQGFADTLRKNDSLRGYALSDPERGSLGGSPTVEWNARVSVELQEVLIREIVVLHDGVAWRVRIAAPEGAPTEARSEAEELVGSWRFA